MIKNYITPSGLDKLKSEYNELIHTERPKIVETVAWAASNGDRSENADYIYGKRRLREIDSRVRFLLGRIEAAIVVDPSTVKSQKVVFGATVIVTNEDDVEFEYQIVGEDETLAKNGKISWKSPIAQALIGKFVGDDVTVKKPNGDELFTINKIEFK